MDLDRAEGMRIRIDSSDPSKLHLTCDIQALDRTCPIVEKKRGALRTQLLMKANDLFVQISMNDRSTIGEFNEHRRSDLA